VLRMSTSGHGQPRGFTHCALFYRSRQEYLDEVVPFILEGVAMSQPVLVAVPADNLAALRGALGDVSAEVAMADMTEVGRNPSGLLGELGVFAARHRQRVRIVGECVWPGRTGDEYPACVQHEALANAAFEHHEMTGLCPYDASGLDDAVLADARATHPLLWRAGSAEHSSEYAPDDVLSRYNQPLPRDPTAVSCRVRKSSDLSSARSFAARCASGLGLSSDRVADLQLIATELATNSLQHTGGECRLSFWRHDKHLVCEASDDGRLDDPLAGRRPLADDATSGRGLFLINALADLVRTYTTPTGTTIQVFLRLGRSQASTT
jgi:anti-sigma regulatory factor (Ser/Thr protein kinase)